MDRILPAALALALVACGGQALASRTPVPTPSVSADVRADAQAALEAFLAAMADPEVSYRSVGQLRLGSVDADGRPDVLINTRYDVLGDAYGGSLDIHLRDPKVGGSFGLDVIDGVAHLRRSFPDEPVSFEPPDTLRQPTAIRTLTPDDLVLQGLTDDGLYEFVVTRWIGGDLLGQWLDVGALPDGALPHSEVLAHDSRLFIDAEGVPFRLEHDLTLLPEGSDEPIGGTLVEDFVGLGMYVNFGGAPGPFGATSHDIGVGVDGEQVNGPWVPVSPADGAETATLDVSYPGPGVMLGIEGAIFFVHARDADGEIVLDAILGFEGGTIEIPAGPQMIVAYYRTCSGSCGGLDGPTELCSVEATIEAGGRYGLAVRVLAPELGECTLRGPGASASGDPSQRMHRPSGWAIDPTPEYAPQRAPTTAKSRSMRAG